MTKKEIIDVEVKEKNLKELNIFQRMLEVINELGTVSKNLEVQQSKNNKYKAVGEVDILNAVKPLEHKFGIYSYPFDTNIIEQTVVTQKTQYGDRNLFQIRLERIYRFVNIDKPDEYVEVKSYGDGLDTGDKATGKAMTYADKYALMKAYKISTGDDPDQEASEQAQFKQTHKKGNAPLITEKQIALIEKLYTQEELDKMQSSKNKALINFTLEEASTMIAHRSKK